MKLSKARRIIRQFKKFKNPTAKQKKAYRKAKAAKAAHRANKKNKASSQSSQPQPQPSPAPTPPPKPSRFPTVKKGLKYAKDHPIQTAVGVGVGGGVLHGIFADESEGAPPPPKGAQNVPPPPGQSSAPPPPQGSQSAPSPAAVPPEFDRYQTPSPQTHSSGGMFGKGSKLKPLGPGEDLLYRGNSGPAEPDMLYRGGGGPGKEIEEYNEFEKRRIPSDQERAEENYSGMFGNEPSGPRKMSGRFIDHPDVRHDNLNPQTGKSLLEERIEGRWRKAWDENRDKGFTPGGPGPMDTKTRYERYRANATSGFPSSTPLEYQDWLLWTNYNQMRNAVRNPETGELEPSNRRTLEFRPTDDIEYWRGASKRGGPDYSRHQDGSPRKVEWHKEQKFNRLPEVDRRIPNPIQTAEFRDANRNGIPDRAEGIYAKESDFLSQAELAREGYGDMREDRSSSLEDIVNEMEHEEELDLPKSSHEELLEELWRREKRKEAHANDSFKGPMKDAVRHMLRRAF